MMVKFNLQFFGGRGGASGGPSPSGSSSTSAAVTRAENQIYDLDRKATRTTVRNALNDAPAGTTLAYTYPAGHTIVYEKSSSEDAFGRNMWLQTTLHTDGSVSATRQSAGEVVESVYTANSTKTVSRGFTSSTRRDYNSVANEYKKEFDLD